MEERTGDDEALLGVLYGLNEAEVFSVELLEVCLPTLTTPPAHAIVFLRMNGTWQPRIGHNAWCRIDGTMA